MAETASRELTAPEALIAYKRILAEIIDRRPSGTRQRLATALAKNRSFVSQITNPGYATPVPASHLDVIFEVCHFSSSERQNFSRLYSIAHPRRAPGEATVRSALTVQLPDLGNDERNRKLYSLVSDFVTQVIKLVDNDTQPKRGRSKRQ